MLDPYILKSHPKYMDSQLKEFFPNLTQGRRQFIIRKCMDFFKRSPHEVFGSGFHKEKIIKEGEYYKVFRFKLKRRNIVVGYSVG